MKVGFTGTQRGMTIAQALAVEEWLYLQSARPKEFHHGDCVGADKTAAKLFYKAGVPCIAHPCDIPSKRAYTDFNTEVRAIKPPLVRNHDIVHESDIMIATPFEYMEIMRSGTWATIRFARKLGQPIVLILPDGVVDESN